MAYKVHRFRVVQTRFESEFFPISSVDLGHITSAFFDSSVSSVKWG